MSSISSLGVGSGLALNDLVSQLLEAERKPMSDRYQKRREGFDAEISALGKLKSKMSDFESVVKELRSDNDLNARKPSITHPGFSKSEDGSNENSPENIFTVDAAGSAAAGRYDVAITQLAKGSRLTSADGAFADSTASILSAGTGTLNFDIASTGQSFSINVSAGMTLSELKDAVNSAAGNEDSDTKKPFINASIINTGTGVGSKIVFTSDVTGDGNDLVVTNTTSDGVADLNTLSSASSGGTMTTSSAQNATALIDGLAVTSDKNDFENVIENVTIEAREVSSKDSNGDYQTSRLTVGLDKESLKGTIDNFVSKYNELIDEINTLSKYGSSELQDDGALAGDSMVRGIRDGLSKIVGSGVTGSTLGSLYGIGISFDDEGKLEITGSDEFGFGSGQKRLDDALDDNFDEVAKLFTSDTDGIANQLADYIAQYSQTGGLISTRKSAVDAQKSSVDDDVAAFELRMLSREDTLKRRYQALDLSIAQMNRTQNALLASLGF
jgi:flagellar hook-associated protein 2